MDPAVSKKKFERELEIMRSQASRFVEAAAWDFVETTYPTLSVVFPHPKTSRRVGFRFLCDGWDDIPPSLTLFDPDTKEELPWAKWPQQGWPAGQAHPTTGKPFLCLPGLREYHTHTSHLNEPWSNLRGRDSYLLRYILHRVHYRYGDHHG